MGKYKIKEHRLALPKLDLHRRREIVISPVTVNEMPNHNSATLLKETKSIDDNYDFITDIVPNQRDLQRVLRVEMISHLNRSRYIKKKY